MVLAFEPGKLCTGLGLASRDLFSCLRVERRQERRAKRALALEVKRVRWIRYTICRAFMSTSGTEILRDKMEGIRGLPLV